MKTLKQIMAGFLVMAMVTVGFFSTSASVDVVEAAETSVSYEERNIADYWSKDSKRVPVKEGYVFGGWFTKNGSAYVAIKEADIVTSENGNASATQTTYAKFVPAYVLSVKAQIDKKTQDANGVAESADPAFLRVISTVDSTDYQQVGFDLFYDKTYKENEKTVVTKVYKKIKNDETKGEGWDPKVEFGAASEYFSVLKVNRIAKDNCDNILYVRPYWITMDGTRVEGLSKYVRVMDGYNENRYISVPINLMTGAGVAAGTLEMTYNTNLQVVEYEAGVLLPEMDVNMSKEGTIKFVGNIVAANQMDSDVEPETGIYANVWFQVKEGVVKPAQWEFSMDKECFCNWAEDIVADVKAWDIQY